MTDQGTHKEATLLQSGLTDGVWTCTLGWDAQAAEPPALHASHNGTQINSLAVSPGPNAGEWSVEVTLPMAVLSDGVQSVLLADGQTMTPITNLTLLAGEMLDEDLRAEIALLRAELDLLKRAFRRHATDQGD